MCIRDRYKNISSLSYSSTVMKLNIHDGGLCGQGRCGPIRKLLKCSPTGILAAQQNACNLKRCQALRSHNQDLGSQLKCRTGIPTICLELKPIAHTCYTWNSFLPTNISLLNRIHQVIEGQKLPDRDPCRLEKCDPVARRRDQATKDLEMIPYLKMKPETCRSLQSPNGQSSQGVLRRYIGTNIKYSIGYLPQCYCTP